LGPTGWLTAIFQPIRTKALGDNGIPGRFSVRLQPELGFACFATAPPYWFATAPPYWNASMRRWTAWRPQSRAGGHGVGLSACSVFPFDPELKHREHNYRISSPAANAHTSGRPTTSTSTASSPNVGTGRRKFAISGRFQVRTIKIDQALFERLTRAKREVVRTKGMLERSSNVDGRPNLPNTGSGA